MHAKTQSQVLAQGNVKDFFQELVEDACTHQKIAINTETRFYVVNLLSSFVHSDGLGETQGRRHIFQPLAELYSNAVEQENRSLRYQWYRRLGDVALFVSGLFAQSLDRRLVDMDYYIAMGGGAYGVLSRSGLNDIRPGFSEIYEELSQRFVGLVDVLGEVSEKANLSKTPDPLRVYETWLRTGSPRARERLVQMGMYPDQELTKKTH